MKLLRKYIKNIILENLHPKIDEILYDRFLEVYNNPFVEIIRTKHPYFGGDMFEIYLQDGKNELGTLEMWQPSSATKKRDDKVYWPGPCNGAFLVKWVGTRDYDKPGGIGVLLYEVAIELASILGSGLTSDRFEVSGYALSVWEKYYGMRSDVQLLAMDIKRDPFTKPTEDDCVSIASAEYYGWNQAFPPEHPTAKASPEYVEYWKTQDPLAKIYRKTPHSTILELFYNRALELKNVTPEELGLTESEDDISTG